MSMDDSDGGSATASYFEAPDGDNDVAMNEDPEDVPDDEDWGQDFSSTKPCTPRKHQVTMEPNRQRLPLKELKVFRKDHARPGEVISPYHHIKMLQHAPKPKNMGPRGRFDWDSKSIIWGEGSVKASYVRHPLPTGADTNTAQEQLGIVYTAFMQLIPNDDNLCYYGDFDDDVMEILSAIPPPDKAYIFDESVPRPADEPDDDKNQIHLATLPPPTLSSVSQLFLQALPVIQAKVEVNRQIIIAAGRPGFTKYMTQSFRQAGRKRAREEGEVEDTHEATQGAQNMDEAESEKMDVDGDVFVSPPRRSSRKRVQSERGRVAEEVKALFDTRNWWKPKRRGFIGRDDSGRA